jgi:hypothetical protein
LPDGGEGHGFDLRLAAGAHIDDVDALLLAGFAEVDLDERAGVVGVGQGEVLWHVDMTEGGVLGLRRKHLPFDDVRRAHVEGALAAIGPPT